jgi:hypothetical protein
VSALRRDVAEQTLRQGRAELSSDAYGR